MLFTILTFLTEYTELFKKMNLLQEHDPTLHNVLHIRLFDDVINHTDTLLGFDTHSGHCTDDLIGYSYLPLMSVDGLYFEMHTFQSEGREICFVLSKMGNDSKQIPYMMKVELMLAKTSNQPIFDENLMYLTYSDAQTFAIPPPALPSLPPEPIPPYPLSETTLPPSLVPPAYLTDGVDGGSCRNECFNGDKIVDIFCESMCDEENLLNTAILLFKYASSIESDMTKRNAYVRAKIDSCIAPLHPPSQILTNDDVYDFIELRMSKMQEMLCN